MQDREPQVGREGRVRITQDDGTVIEGVLEMADNATIQGTPYNKATQLSDSVAQALKLTPVEEATVNDALGLLPGINEQILALRTGEVKLAYGIISSMGSSHTFELDWEPVMLLLMSTTKPPYFGDSSAGVNYMMAIAGVPEVTGTNISSPDLVWGANSIAVSSLGGSLTDTVAYLIIGRKQLSTLTLSVLNASGEHQDGCVVSFGENDPFVTDGSGPITLQSVANKPVLTVVSPLDYGGEVQTQTLDFSSTQNLSVDVTVDTSTHLTSGTITSSIVGAFSSQVTSVDVFCLGGGGNGFLSQYLNGYIIDLYGSGGAGGGYAVKNNLDVSENLITIVPGGRAGTSYFAVGDNIACRATGGGNGNSAVINVRPPSPGVGNVGDTLLSGATPGWFQIQSNGRYAPVNAVAGEYSTDPFSGESIGGAGYSSFNKNSSPAYYGATQPTQNGGGGTVYQQDGAAPGAGGGGMTNRYSEGEEYTRAGYGVAGYVKWRVAQ